MKIRIILIALIASILCSCGEYTRLQKSTDPNEKYLAGKDFYQEKKYSKAVTMFESITSYYRGTPQAEEILYLLGMSYMGLKDYASAAQYFDTYLRNFPRGSYAEECTYQLGVCYYVQAPDSRLDQTETTAALETFDEFVSLYPYSEKIEDVNKKIVELTEKLAYKEYLSAKLYLDLGLYGGNNYRACVVQAENALKDYPDTKYRDDLVFIILNAKYKEAKMSVVEKQKERFSDVVDEYYRYYNEFPEGKHIKEATTILKEARKVVE